MKYSAFLAVAVVLCFVFFGGNEDKPKPTYSPHGMIVDIQPRGRLIIKMEAGHKIVADLIDGYKSWQEGAVVRVYQGGADPGASRIIDVDSKRRATVLLGRY